MVGGGVMLFPIRELSILKRHQFLLRKSEYHLNAGHRLPYLLYRAQLYMVQNRYGLHIPLNCCGKGLHIMHLGPILINSNAVVRENCSLHINTGIVAGGTNDDVPVLDKGVVMGIGAVALGKIHIAENVAVGANAVVNKSVEEKDIAVGGVPAKKISNNGRTQWNKNKE